MSNKKCCVPGCENCLETKVNLHKFPNPDKDKELFNTWVYSVGGDILNLENNHIFKYRRVCHVHFDNKYHCWNSRISKNAVPTINMPGLLVSKFHMKALQHLQLPEASTSKEPGTSHPDLVTMPVLSQSIGVDDQVNETCEFSNNQKTRHINKKYVKRVAVTQSELALYNKLQLVRVKLSKCRNKAKKQAKKIKLLQNITKNPQFLQTLEQILMSSTSKILTLLKFREHKKRNKGSKSNISYLADKQIIPEEAKNTADLILFFDRLFDSVNGSHSKKKYVCQAFVRTCNTHFNPS